MEKSLQIILKLKGKHKEMFKELKDHLGLGYNTEVCKHAIKRLYDIEIKEKDNNT